MPFAGECQAVLEALSKWQESGPSVCVHTAGTLESWTSVFQMTMARLSLASLGGHLLVLLTSEPYGFTSGAGFFQNHSKENHQRGLTDLSVYSSWRHRFLTYKPLGPWSLEQREVGQNGS